MTLPEALMWLVWGGGAGILAFGLIEMLKALPKFEEWWNRLPSDVGRAIAFIISSVFAVAGFLIQVGMGYEPVPGDFTVWLEVLWSIVIAQLAYILSKLVRRLRRA